MNKINVLFLSSLMLVVPSAYGMNAQGAPKQESYWSQATNFAKGLFRDVRTSVRGANEDVKEQADAHLPNRVYKNARKEVKEEVKGFKKDVKGFKKDTDEIVNDVFEVSEILAGFAGHKQSYNSYISSLDELKSEAKNLSTDKNLDEDDKLEFEEADYKDLIDAEKKALKKKQEVLDKERQKSVPVAPRRNGKGNVRQQRPAQQPVAVASMSNHVAQLKRSVEDFNHALNNQNNPQPQQQQQKVKQGKRFVWVNVQIPNHRLSVVDAKKALNEKIDDFKKALEGERKEACKNSPFGDFVYGGPNIRRYVALGAIALGALCLGDRLKDSASGQKVSTWFAQSAQWILTKFMNTMGINVDIA